LAANLTRAFNVLNVSLSNKILKKLPGKRPAVCMDELCTNPAPGRAQVDGLSKVQTSAEGQN
jgi:hypothetical protein